MTPRFHIPDARLQAGLELSLPPNAARHAQVLRLQPGDPITLFDGNGGQWQAQMLDMGRKQVSARVLIHQALEHELPAQIMLALGMPANERMDALVEKATELGAARIQPLVCERSVLRVAGERAERKASHWQAVAASACEQSGRNQVPPVEPPIALRDWLKSWRANAGAQAGSGAPATGTLGWMLSLAEDAQPIAQALRIHSAGLTGRTLLLLSGPEGGLSPTEQAAAVAAGFEPVSLGPRVLRADTAPLAALAVLAAMLLT